MSKRLTASVLSALVIAAPTHAEESTGLPITVTATRFAEPTASVLAPVNIITRKEIEQLHARSLTDVVKTLPGVEMVSNGGRGQQSSVLVRGTTSAETLVLMDGVRINSRTNGETDFSSIPLNQVERIEFIRGARASVYGADAIGGVINIITRGTTGQNKQTINGGAGSRDYQNLNGSSSFDINPQQHLKLAAGYETEDGYNTRPVTGVNDGDKHGFLGNNAMLDYQNQVNDNTNVFGALHWTRNTSQSDSSYTGHHERDETWDENTNYQLGTKYKKERYQTELNTSLINDNMYYYPDTISREQANSVYQTSQYQISWLNNYQVTDPWTVGSGIDWHRDVLKSGSQSSGSAFFDQDKGRDNVGVYALSQYHWAQWLGELSGRTDDNQQYGRHNTWQAGLGWNFVPEYRLSTRYGTAFRAPTFNDLYTPYSVSPNLKPETSKNSEVALEGTTAGVLWRVTGYRNDIDQMIQWASSDPTDPYAMWFPENVGRARIKGVELEAEFATGWLNHKISADFKDAQDLENDTPLARRAKRNYKWTGSANWEKWDSSLTGQYQSERFDNSARLAPYSLWDAAVGYHVLPQLRIGGRVDNLFDKDYTVASGYATPERSYYLDFSYQM
ncbi:TonB-dependent receptor domain-containing protein [uncultured Tolumonas sp.]|uniref:TonB-dependent receptor domain-containing protein n=1 Tax=uncultured Tolumonas sp. TaxID=263765 RepID=UPI00292DC35D|nr:TonB-dependent receptor [uncultured Tolumonas sp.]